MPTENISVGIIFAHIRKIDTTNIKKAQQNTIKYNKMVDNSKVVYYNLTIVSREGRKFNGR